MRRFRWLAVTAVAIVASLSLVAGCSDSGPSEIRIGIIEDLSGPTSAWGEGLQNGAIYAIEKLNKEGGLLGKQIKYISYDFKGNVPESLTAYNRLVDQDKVVADHRHPQQRHAHRRRSAGRREEGSHRRRSHGRASHHARGRQAEQVHVPRRALGGRPGQGDRQLRPERDGAEEGRHPVRPGQPLLRVPGHPLRRVLQRQGRPDRGQRAVPVRHQRLPAAVDQDQADQSRRDPHHQLPEGELPDRRPRRGSWGSPCRSSATTPASCPSPRPPARPPRAWSSRTTSPWTTRATRTTSRPTRPASARIPLSTPGWATTT